MNSGAVQRFIFLCTRLIIKQYKTNVIKSEITDLKVINLSDDGRYTTGILMMMPWY